MYWIILAFISILSSNAHDQCRIRAPCGWDICRENREKHFPGYACNKCIYCGLSKNDRDKPKADQYCKVINDECVYKINDNEKYECIQKIIVPNNFIGVAGTKSGDVAFLYTWIYSEDTYWKQGKLFKKTNDYMKKYQGKQWEAFRELIKGKDPPKSVLNWIERKNKDTNAEMNFIEYSELMDALSDYKSTETQRKAICKTCEGKEKHIDRVKCIVDQIHQVLPKAICTDCNKCVAAAKKTLIECFDDYKDNENIKYREGAKYGYDETHAFIVIEDIEIDTKKSNLYIDCNNKFYVQQKLDGEGEGRRILLDPEDENICTDSRCGGIVWDCDSCLSPTLETIIPNICGTMNPTSEPTINPTINPTSDPTSEPTTEPTIEPTIDPTSESQKGASLLDKFSMNNHIMNDHIIGVLIIAMLIVMVFMNIICCISRTKIKAMDNKIYKSVNSKQCIVDDFDVEIENAENVPIYQ